MPAARRAVASSLPEAGGVRLAAGALSHSLQPGRMAAGHRVQVLCDGGAAYPAMLEAIASARLWIDLETYIFRDDATGRRFVHALAEKARAGVAVRCVIDGAGSHGLDPAVWEPMVEAGVELEVFHPVGPWRAHWGWSVRDHRKLLLVDGRIAFTGGFNIGDEYAPREEPWRGGGWRDVGVRVEGPVVAELQALFDSTFRHVAPAARQLPRRAPAPQADGEARVQALAAGRRRDRKQIQNHYLYAVHTAKRSVLIQSAYFIPNRSWRRALVAAAGRGCDVRVMVPLHSDVPGIRWASQYTWTRLLRGGVRILEFLPTMLHAKTVLVDDEWAAIGSYNLDQRSLSYNLEVALAIVDRAVCAALRERFEADARESQEVARDLWEKRGTFQRLKEKLVYFFRLWL